jgi:hypothetical protein
MAAAPAHAKAHRLTKLPSDTGFVVMGGVGAGVEVMGGVVVLPEGAGIEVMGGEVVATSLVQLILT